MKIPKNKQYIMFGGIFVLSNKLQAVADKKMKGLSTKQWFMLRNLSDLPTEPLPTISMLAKETDTSRQNTSKMLEVLEREGYVALHEGQEDRRSRRVELTKTGRQILGQVAKESEPFFKELFSKVSQHECEAAADVVIKLIGRLNEMQEEEE